uniref:ORF 1; putative n=1 Tax=Trypanosoma brucei TaxID=5691 RepID=Q26740_9TRYP|nr:ORF 1; putative [Trypanosoma brucei]
MKKLLMIEHMCEALLAVYEVQKVCNDIQPLRHCYSRQDQLYSLNSCSIL